MQKRLAALIITAMAALTLTLSAAPAFAAKAKQFSDTIVSEVKLNIQTKTASGVASKAVGGSFQMLNNENILLTPNQYTRGLYSSIYIPTSLLESFPDQSFERIFFQPKRGTAIVGIPYEMADNHSKNYVSIHLREYSKRPTGYVGPTWSISSASNKNSCLRIGFPLDSKDYSDGDIQVVMRIGKGWAVVEGLTTYIDNSSDPAYLFTDYKLGSGVYGVIFDDGGPKMTIDLSQTKKYASVGQTSDKSEEVEIIN